MSTCRQILFSIICICFILSSSANAQGKIYKYSRIYLKNGKTVKHNNAQLIDGYITYSFKDKNGLHIKAYDLEKVEHIMVSSKNCTLDGAIIGTVAGTLTMLVIKGIVQEKEVHGTIVKQDLPTYTKAGIIVLGNVAGGIIGSFFVKDWKNIYTNDTSELWNFRLGLSSVNKNSYVPALSMIRYF